MSPSQVCYSCAKLQMLGNVPMGADSSTSPQGTSEPASVTSSSCTAASAPVPRCGTSSPATPCSCSAWMRGASPGWWGQMRNAEAEERGLPEGSVSCSPPGDSSSSG